MHVGHIDSLSASFELRSCSGLDCAGLLTMNQTTYLNFDWCEESSLMCVRTRVRVRFAGARISREARLGPYPSPG